MKAFKIETDTELDQIGLSVTLRRIADSLDDDDIESCELMDGSYRIETPWGIAFLSIIEENEN